MSDLDALKQAARKAAFVRRKAAHAAQTGTAAALLSEILAGYRGVPLAGYMPIRTEIDPLPAMAEASAHGRVGVPVITGAGKPLKFSRWEPGAEMTEGAFGAMIPATDDFFEPEIPNDKYVVAVHEPEYFYDLLNIKIPAKEARKIGFPLTENLVERERIIVDGTLKGCEFALKNGIAMNIAGGTHHAFTNRAEAFCMLNDQAIGARYLQAKNLAKKILIIDLDVHQGNGTAEIFKNDASVYTFSMHGADNYPFKKEISDLT